MKVMKMRFVKRRSKFGNIHFATSKWHAFSLQVKWISELYITLSFNKAFETSRIRDGPLENLRGGRGRSTKKIFVQGKIK